MPDDITRGGDGKFSKGNPGGPGRPRSAVSRGAVALDEMGADRGRQLFEVMMDKALAGDMRAAELLMSRIWPARRGRPVEIETPPIHSVPDYVAAAAGVANAMLRGEITPHEGRAVSALLDLQVRTLDQAEIERQIRELREQIAENKAASRHRSVFAPSSTDSTTVFDRFSGGRDDGKD